MSLAKTPDSTVAPMAGRRRFGAGLLAIGAGSVLTSGVAAGMATVAGDLTPADADTTFIQACQRFTATELRCIAIMDGAASVENDADANRLCDQLRGAREDNNHWPALNAICTTPATSPAAAVALASALAVWAYGSVEAPGDDPSDYVGERITHALLRCLLGSA